MKHTLKKILVINCTLDSSETIMFTKGGQHTIELCDFNEQEDDRIDFHSFDSIKISFQMEKDQQARFDHITSEANVHREMWDKINLYNEKKGEESKKRMKAYAEQAENIRIKQENEEASLNLSQKQE